MARSSLVSEEVVPVTMVERGAAGSPAYRALGHDDAQIRMRAAMEVGSRPDGGYVAGLVERCAVEPELFVRETLTWALTRHPAELTVPALVAELRSEGARARSQALHTLSKIGDQAAWPAITKELMRDADDEVARTAWRAAVGLAPEGERPALAEELARQLGRGTRDTQLSLSRALIALGEAGVPVLRAASAGGDPVARVHALATEQLARDPEVSFALAIEEARRVVGPGQEETTG
ncbi:HEAT repeat domain-containing protein [Streptomyces sedi]|uniref:HEAT repeat domain-containing protein n=1 Tax=Streptomyces sedi TaxID=555059 RepID=UPI001FEAFCF2|nr:HEAT repeat domain-containing protein [Streptomyces sedi]